MLLQTITIVLVFSPHLFRSTVY